MKYLLKVYLRYKLKKKKRLLLSEWEILKG